MTDVAVLSHPVALSALKDVIARESVAAGFQVARIARIADLGDGAGRRLQAFLSERLHGDMDWLERTADRRKHPQVLWPDARSAVLLGLSYAPGGNPLDALREKSRGAISVYAQGSDYHDVLKPKLKRIAAALQRASGADVKVFVDTAPLMEKPLAMLSGLGWQGKHTNLVSREHGSWLFLGAILTSADLQADDPEVDHCGSCRRCLDICPTAAFPAPYRLDARRCISYLTIEHKGPIDRELRPLMGNRVYGCDDCLAVCPWNKFAEAGQEALFYSRADTHDPPLGELLQLDDATFRKRFAKTPIKRTGRARFVRNVLIAAGNSGDSGLAQWIEPLLRDESVLVRGAAVWAMARLVDRARFASLTTMHRPLETEPSVLAEWDAELAE